MWPRKKRKEPSEEVKRRLDKAVETLTDQQRKLIHAQEIANKQKDALRHNHLAEAFQRALQRSNHPPQ
jgi:hypothetical protein